MGLVLQWLVVAAVVLGFGVLVLLAWLVLAAITGAGVGAAVKRLSRRRSDASTLVRAGSGESGEVDQLLGILDSAEGRSNNDMTPS